MEDFLFAIQYNFRWRIRQLLFSKILLLFRILEFALFATAQDVYQTQQKPYFYQPFSFCRQEQRKSLRSQNTHQ